MRTRIERVRACLRRVRGWSAAVTGLALVVSGLAAPAGAQDRPAPVGPADPPPNEVMVLGGGGAAVSVAHSAPDWSMVFATVGWTRELTRKLGRGPLAGRLAMGVEVLPIVAISNRTTAIGYGVSPLVLRWNFAPRRTWAAYLELAGGLVRTGEPVPENTTRFNFTAHSAFGARFHVSRRSSMVVAYRFHHLSNGDREDFNPGINTNAFVAGFSLRH